MIKAILFDLDGTLVDSIFDLASCVNTVLQRNSYPTHEVDKFRYFIGNGIPKLIERALPEKVLDAEREKCLLEFGEYYAEHFADRTREYDGIPQILAQLKERGLLTAVVSNKDDGMTASVVKTVFSHRFDFVMGRRDGFAIKPSADMLLFACESLGVRPDECIFVGDSGMDMKAAVNAGLTPVGVLWGYREEGELKENGAKFLAENREDLLKIIMSLV